MAGSFFLYFFQFCLFLAVLGLCSWAGFSPVAVRRDHSSCGAQGPSLPAEHGLEGAQASVAAACGCSSHGVWAQQSWHAGAVVMVYGLCCSAVCGIFLDSGTAATSAALAGRFFTH